jgi:hypothetical protein
MWHSADILHAVSNVAEKYNASIFKVLQIFIVLVERAVQR